MSLLFSHLRLAFIDSAFTLIGSYLLQCFSKLKPSPVHGRNLRARQWENVHWPQFVSDGIGKKHCHQVAEVTSASKRKKNKTSYSQQTFNRKRFNYSQSTNHSTIFLYSVNMRISIILMNWKVSMRMHSLLNKPAFYDVRFVSYLQYYPYYIFYWFYVFFYKYYINIIIWYL